MNFVRVRLHSVRFLQEFVSNWTLVRLHQERNDVKFLEDSYWILVRFLQESSKLFIGFLQESCDFPIIFCQIPMGNQVSYRTPLRLLQQRNDVRFLQDSYRFLVGSLQESCMLLVGFLYESCKIPIGFCEIPIGIRLLLDSRPTLLGKE